MIALGNINGVLLGPRLALVVEHHHIGVGATITALGSDVAATVVRVEPQPKLDLRALELDRDLRWTPLTLADAPRLGDRVSVLRLTHGRPTLNATIVGVNPAASVCRLRVDGLIHTAHPGDSGSPVFDAAGRLLGLLGSASQPIANEGNVRLVAGIKLLLESMMPAIEQPTTTKGRRPQPPMPMRPSESRRQG